MPTHVRTQIRTAVKLALTGLATTADRVFVGRTRPLKDAHDPSLLVYTLAELSNRAVHGQPPELERKVTVSIEGRVSAAAPPDDLLDVIAGEVEAAMRINRNLGGLAFNMQFQQTDVDVQTDGARHLGAIRLQYLVSYRTLEGQPYATPPD